MKKLLKSLKSLGTALGVTTLIVIIMASGYVGIMSPSLPPGASEVIERVIASDPPNFIKGDTSTIENNGVKIWYESRMPADSSKGAIMLFMGIGNDAMGWPEYFLEDLTEAGFQIIRHDYRGTGNSAWLPNYSTMAPYSLDDMTQDATIIMNHLDIEKAHLFGLSMGGMVAQNFAIKNPERTQSLISMSSSAWIEDPTMHGLSTDFIKDMIVLSLRYGLFESETNTLKVQLTSRAACQAGPLPEEDMRSMANQVLFNIRSRRGYNSKCGQQHAAAVSASGSRYEQLPGLKMPVLFIHGKKDPLIPFAHGQKCAELLPEADTYWIEGLGHDVPSKFSEVVTSRMVLHFKKSMLQDSIQAKIN